MGANTSMPAQQTRERMLTVFSGKTEIYHVNLYIVSNQWQLMDCTTNIQLGTFHVSDVVKILLRWIADEENITFMFRFDTYAMPLTKDTDILGLLFTAKSILYRRRCCIPKTPAEPVKVNVQ